MQKLVFLSPRRIEKRIFNEQSQIWRKRRSIRSTQRRMDLQNIVPLFFSSGFLLFSRLLAFFLSFHRKRFIIIFSTQFFLFIWIQLQAHTLTHTRLHTAIVLIIKRLNDVNLNIHSISHSISDFTKAKMRIKMPHSTRIINDNYLYIFQLIETAAAAAAAAPSMQMCQGDFDKITVRFFQWNSKRFL